MATGSFSDAGATLKRRYFMPLVLRILITVSTAMSLFAILDSSWRDQHTVFSVFSVVMIAASVLLMIEIWALPQTIITTQGIRRLNSVYRTIPWAKIKEFSTREVWPSRDVVYARLTAGNKVYLGGVPARDVTELKRNIAPVGTTSSA